MRDNEIAEDILILAAVLLLAPILLFVVLALGVTLMYTWPLILMVIFIATLIRAKLRDKPVPKPGKVKLLVLPDWAKRSIIAVISIPISILIIAGLLFALVCMPAKVAGYAVMSIFIFIFLRIIYVD